jgi:hypothetical protein
VVAAKLRGDRLQQGPANFLTQAQGIGDSSCAIVRRRDGRKVGEAYVWQDARKGEGKPGLAGATRADQRDQPLLDKQLAQLGDLALASYEACQAEGQ